MFSAFIPINQSVGRIYSDSEPGSPAVNLCKSSSNWGQLEEVPRQGKFARQIHGNRGNLISGLPPESLPIE